MLTQSILFMAEESGVLVVRLWVIANGDFEPILEWECREGTSSKQ